MHPPIMILYHAGCFDGFTAAWAVWRGLGRKKVELVPVSYGTPPPDVEGCMVYIVDFSYPRDVLEQMNEEAAALLVLDHHKTAEKELAGLPYCVFDMERSGAVIAWDHFAIDWPADCSDPPVLVRYVQDRDLWKNELPNTLAINAFIRSFAFDLDGWDKLALQLEDIAPMAYHLAISEGEAILRQASADRDRLLGSNLRMSTLRVGAATHHVPVINASQFGVSDLLHEVIGGGPIESLDGFFAVWAIAWWQRKDGLFQYSLRSSDDGPDVSEIAAVFGGGGHRNAAGFEHASLLFK